MLAGEIYAEASLHRGDDLDVVSVLHHALDEQEVREVVLDIEHRLTTRGLGNRCLGPGGVAVEPVVAFDRSFDDGKLDPEGATFPEHGLDVERSAHRFGEAARKCEAYARSFDIGAVGAKAFERREQEAHLIGSYPRSAVGDLDTQPGRQLFAGDRDGSP